MPSQPPLAVPFCSRPYVLLASFCARSTPRLLRSNGDWSDVASAPNHVIRFVR